MHPIRLGACAHLSNEALQGQNCSKYLERPFEGPQAHLHLHEGFSLIAIHTTWTAWPSSYSGSSPCALPHRLECWEMRLRLRNSCGADPILLATACRYSSCKSKLHELNHPEGSKFTIHLNTAKGNVWKILLLQTCCCPVAQVRKRLVS